jgi:hypothetical protein
MHAVHADSRVTSSGTLRGTNLPLEFGMQVAGWFLSYSDQQLFSVEDSVSASEGVANRTESRCHVRPSRGTRQIVQQARTA